MKKVFLLLVLGSAMALTACGQQTSRGGLNRGGRLPSGAGLGAQSLVNNSPLPSYVNSQSTSSGFGWGIIQPTSSAAVKAFLSTDFTPDQVGDTVGCQTGAMLTGSPQPCAIEFAVTSTLSGNPFPAALSGGTLSMALQSGQTMGFQPGFITIIIWDSLTGTPSPADGTPLPPIPVVIPLDTSQSYVRSSQELMVFDDGDGSVALNGNVNSIMSGSFMFMDTSSLTGQIETTPVTMGNFQVSTCSALICQ